MSLHPPIHPPPHSIPQVPKANKVTMKLIGLDCFDLGDVPSRPGYTAHFDIRVPIKKFVHRKCPCFTVPRIPFGQVGHDSQWDELQGVQQENIAKCLKAMAPKAYEMFLNGNAGNDNGDGDDNVWLDDLYIRLEIHTTDMIVHDCAMNDRLNEEWRARLHESEARELTLDIQYRKKRSTDLGDAVNFIQAPMFKNHRT